MKETTMKLNKKEQKFIADNIMNYDSATITVSDTTIRISGRRPQEIVLFREPKQFKVTARTFRDGIPV